MVLSCGPLIMITLLYFALPGGRHSDGSLICLTIRIRSCYQLSVTHFLSLKNCANDQRALLLRVCSHLLVLFIHFTGTVLVMGSMIHLLVLMHYIVVIILTGHMICPC
jgi:hypothetical protein